MPTANSRVSQLELAHDLGVTDRRVRQLEAERILPRFNAEEGYDLELCRRRYLTYSSGTAQDWERAFDEAEDLARLAEELTDKAYADRAVVADVTAASKAIQASTAAMSFLTAAKSKSQTEREMLWGIWETEEKRAIGALFGRLAELLGATRLQMDDGAVLELRPTSLSPVTKQPVRAAKKRKAG